MELFVNTNYDILKWRFRAIVFSLIIILIGVVLFFTRPLNLGIDFAGGAEVILKFQDAMPIDELRQLAPDATIQEYGKTEEHTFLIRLPQQDIEGDYAGEFVRGVDQKLNQTPEGKIDLNLQGRDAIAELLGSANPDNVSGVVEAQQHYDAVARNVIDRRSELGIFTSMDQVVSTPGLSAQSAAELQKHVVLGRFNVLNQETVGPQVGKELQRKAILAILLSTLAMGIYVAVRFDFKFGIAALVCLLHDVLIALAFLLMFNGEFEILTVAALLMVVGYSINDTVVVYDRVRENVKKHRLRESFASVMNKSMNQTLSRTILTGGTVTLVLISLIIFGGEVINEFAWLLLIGTLAGTYSSLTVVPAVVLAWNRYVSKKAGLYGGGEAAREAKAAGGVPAAQNNH